MGLWVGVPRSCLAAVLLSAQCSPGLPPSGAPLVARLPLTALPARCKDLLEDIKSPGDGSGKIMTCSLCNALWPQFVLLLARGDSSGPCSPCSQQLACAEAKRRRRSTGACSCHRLGAPGQEGRRQRAAPLSAVGRFQCRLSDTCPQRVASRFAPAWPLCWLGPRLCTPCRATFQQMHQSGIMADKYSTKESLEVAAGVLDWGS